MIFATFDAGIVIAGFVLALACIGIMDKMHKLEGRIKALEDSQQTEIVKPDDT